MVLAAFPRGPVTSSAGERLALAEAEALLRERQGRVLLSDGRGKQAELPETAVRLIQRVVRALANGYPVDVTVLPRELTIQRAAELLDLRPEDVVRLVDQGEIPTVETGGLQRIRFEDVMAYKPKRDAERRAALDEMTRLAEEMGLYDLEEDRDLPTAVDGTRHSAGDDSRSSP